MSIFILREREQGVQLVVDHPGLERGELRLEPALLGLAHVEQVVEHQQHEVRGRAGVLEQLLVLVGGDEPAQLDDLERALDGGERGLQVVHDHVRHVLAGARDQLQLVVLLYQLVVRLAQVQVHLRAREQFLRGEGLVHVVLRAALEAVQARLEVPARGEEDDAHLGAGVAVPLGHEVQPGAVGQADVEDGQLRAVGGEQPPAFRGGGAAVHVYARGLQDGLAVVEDDEVVLDDEHARRHVRSLDRNQRSDKGK
jgi:exonuclease VII small subunit